MIGPTQGYKMHFLEMLDGEIAAQERLLEAHPAFIKLKALRATRDAYGASAASYGASVAAMSTGSDAPPKSFLSGAGSRPRGAPLSGKSLDAVSAVIEILRLHKRPIRTAPLMDLVAQRGIEFSGNAPQNVLSSLLSRSPDVVSKGGHIGWALKEWDTAGGDELGGNAPPAVDETPAKDREAGSGGGT